MRRFLKNIIQLAVLYLYIGLIASADEQQNQVEIGSFTTGSLANWKNKEFKGQTGYRLIKIDDLQVLEAESNAAASGLFFEQRIDLQKTPILNWRWRIEKPLVNPDEQIKDGDDFAARIYVVVSGGLVFWNTKSINYVWASTAPKEATWPNPFAGDHVMMIAVRSTADKIGTWYTEKRNIRADFKKLMGDAIQYIDAVAIMTDTDNAKGHAKAYYGDIYFTAD